MAKKPKRQKAIKKLNLSDHTLDINIRRCNYNKFNFSDIEDYVKELVGSRDYQYKAIFLKPIMSFKCTAFTSFSFNKVKRTYSIIN